MPELPLADVICAVYAPGGSVSNSAESMLGFGNAKAPTSSAAVEIDAGFALVVHPVFVATTVPLPL